MVSCYAMSILYFNNALTANSYFGGVFLAGDQVDDVFVVIMKTQHLFPTLNGDLPFVYFLRATGLGCHTHLLKRIRDRLVVRVSC